MIGSYIDRCANNSLLSNREDAGFVAASGNVIKWGCRSVCHVVAAVFATIELIVSGALFLVGRAFSWVTPTSIFPEKALTACDAYCKWAISILVRSIDDREIPEEEPALQQKKSTSDKSPKTTHADATFKKMQAQAAQEAREFAAKTREEQKAMLLEISKWVSPKNWKSLEKLNSDNAKNVAQLIKLRPDLQARKESFDRDQYINSHDDLKKEIAQKVREFRIKMSAYFQKGYRYEALKRYFDGEDRQITTDALQGAVSELYTQQCLFQYLSEQAPSPAQDNLDLQPSAPLQDTASSLDDRFDELCRQYLTQEETAHKSYMASQVLVFRNPTSFDRVAFEDRYPEDQFVKDVKSGKITNFHEWVNVECDRILADLGLDCRVSAEARQKLRHKIIESNRYQFCLWFIQQMEEQRRAQPT